MYLGGKFHYTAIKTTERQTEETEETEELLRGLFDSEESEAVKRKMNCKVIMYNECNEYNKHNENNKCNNNEHDESNKNWQLISLMMSSDTEDVLMQIVWRRNIRSIDS